MIRENYALWIYYSDGDCYSIFDRHGEMRLCMTSKHFRFELQLTRVSIRSHVTDSALKGVFELIEDTTSLDENFYH
jgi:hypothetical protein